jgi:hypothetical protein
MCLERRSTLSKAVLQLTSPKQSLPACLTARLVDKLCILDYHFICFPFFLHNAVATYIVSSRINRCKVSRMFLSERLLSSVLRSHETYRSKVLDALLVQLPPRALIIQADIFPFTYIQPISRITEPSVTYNVVPSLDFEIQLLF